MTDPMQIEAALQEYGWPDVDMPCFVCGNRFALRRAGVEVVDPLCDGADPARVLGNVCPDCLEKTDEEIRRHLIVHAERLEEDARFFRALAEAGLPLPTRGHLDVFEEEVNKQAKAHYPWTEATDGVQG